MTFQSWSNTIEIVPIKYNLSCLENWTRGVNSGSLLVCGKISWACFFHKWECHFGWVIVLPFDPFEETFRYSGTFFQERFEWIAKSNSKSRTIVTCITQIFSQ